jgi:hypothetical protein
MKSWSSARGTITASARSAFAIEFDAVGPMHAKELCTGWSRDRVTKHANIVHLGELFMFILTPEPPSREGLEAMTSKAWESTLFLSDSLGLDGMNAAGRRRIMGRMKMVMDEGLNVAVPE